MKATKKFKGMEDKELSFLKKKGATKAMVGHEVKEMKSEKPVEMAFGGMLTKFMKDKLRKEIAAKQGVKSQNSEMPRRRTASFAEPQSVFAAGAKAEKLGSMQRRMESLKQRKPELAERYMKRHPELAPEPRRRTVSFAEPQRNVMAGTPFKDAMAKFTANKGFRPMAGNVSTIDNTLAAAKAGRYSNSSPPPNFSALINRVPSTRSAPPMQPNKPITPAPESVAPESAGGNMKKGGKVMKKGGCTKMATGGIAKANNAKGDISGKLFKASAGEGIEKSYKANTKAVKHRQGDGCAQRGLTKIGRSKEM